MISSIFFVCKKVGEEILSQSPNMQPCSTVDRQQNSFQISKNLKSMQKEKLCKIMFSVLAENIWKFPAATPRYNRFLPLQGQSLFQNLKVNDN